MRIETDKCAQFGINIKVFESIDFSVKGELDKQDCSFQGEALNVSTAFLIL